KAPQSVAGRVEVSGQSGAVKAASGQKPRGLQTKAVGAEEKALFPAEKQTVNRSRNGGRADRIRDSPQTASLNTTL
ncbi:hypothetical protein ETR_21177, partial [Erwinia tracheiphila PSU-1]|uniref:hypothetical protein n=1 Tax=Erwinia tracheiphila TaxID=65700 RepID=UPI0003381DD4